jgi:DNA-binding NarL/FixJ family response regulator
MTSGLLNRKVLVVDDQQLVRMAWLLFSAFRKISRLQIQQLMGEEALDKALKLLPDIILMDIRMPIMDGITATGLISKRYLPARC